MIVQRELYMDKIKRLINNELIKVITGVRRCGKSTLLRLIKNELLNRGINEENIILINFESENYRDVNNSEELDLLIKNLVEDINGKYYLFFDEIQNVNNWERSIAGYKVDYDCDIYITGSNSKLLSGELATHLTGRYIEIHTYPFSFKEYLKYYDNFDNIEEAFNEYLLYGGMPGALSLYKEEKREYLTDVFNSIFYNDLVKRYRIRDIDLLERLMRFILDNVGKEFSTKSIKEYLNKKAKIKVAPKTINNYLNYIESTCLIKKVEREDLEGKAILKLNEKYYVADHGISQAIIGKNQQHIGRILENIVYYEFLRRGYAVTIGKTKDYEVDFVCKKDNGIIYIQVTYSLGNEETLEREFRPFYNIKDNFPKYVISTDRYDFSKDGIINLNIIDFLTDYSLIK